MGKKKPKHQKLQLPGCVLCLSVKKDLFCVSDESEAELLNVVISEILKKYYCWTQNITDKALICTRCWKITYTFHEFYTELERIHKNKGLSSSSCFKIKTEIEEHEISFASVDVECELKEEEEPEQLKDTREFLKETLKDQVEVDEKNALDEQESIKDTVDQENNWAENESLLKSEEGNIQEIKEQENIPEEVINKSSKKRTKKDDDNYTDQNTEAADSDYEEANTSSKKRTIRTRRKSSRVKYDESDASHSSSEEDSNESADEDTEILKLHGGMHCTLCGEDFKRFKDFQKHFKPIHDIKNPGISCLKCDMKIKNKPEFLDHLKAHERPEDFKCTKCDKTILGTRKLQYHMDNHKEKEENEAAGICYTCNDCGKAFKRSDGLVKHKENMHTEKSFKCDLCETQEKMYTKEQLKKHILWSHKRERLMCEICSRVFRHVSMYKKHVKQHDPDYKKPTFDCTMCGQSYLSKPPLKKHIRHVHLNVYEPSPCERCGKIFHSKEKLASHKSGVCFAKLKYCNVCGKDFRVTKALKEHMTTHTGEMIYNCQFCQEKFAFHSQLYIHYAKFHPVEWEAVKVEKRLYKQGTNS